MTQAFPHASLFGGCPAFVPFSRLRTGEFWKNSPIFINGAGGRAPSIFP